MRLIAVLLFAIAPGAMAAEIFKCRDAAGAITFQQVPCAAGSEVARQQYVPQPDAPHEQYVPSRDGPQVAQHAAVPSTAPTLGATGIRPHAAGFACTDGSRTWIQDAPCPSTTTRVRSDFVTGTTTSGQRFNGTVTRRENVPVDSQALDRDALCEKIAKGAATSSKKRRASDDSYERNKMRRELGC